MKKTTTNNRFATAKHQHSVLFILLLSAFCLLTTSCGSGIYEGKDQKYYVADLEGDPNNRNIFRATTIWNEDATFELLIPDYWEVKEDKNDEYNTDIYLVSNEYDDNACLVLPGTMGYGVSDDLKIEQWYTLIPWGGADDYYFYETISDTEQKPIMRVIEFVDGDGNYYLFEMHFPQDEDYTACHEDFSNIITTFSTLNTTLEETYIEAEIFQPKWVTFAIKNKGSDDDRIVVDYPPMGWIVDKSEEGLDYVKNEEYGCEIHAGMEDKDPTELASYEEDVLVMDNNDMAKQYTLYDENGAVSEIYVTVNHNEIDYNFAIKNINDMCLDDALLTVKSFRTYDEEMAIRKGIEMIDEEEEAAEEATTEETEG